MFALKLLNPGADSETAARFQREAQIAARLQHPGIVPVIDQGHERGRTYLVMEHVRGQTLKERLRARGAMPWKEAALLVIALADAVDTAHRDGVVHMANQAARAIPELEEAIRRADGQRSARGRVRARAWLGVAYLLTDREERAVQTWLAAIRIGPTHPATYKFLSYLHKASRPAQAQVLDAVPPDIRGQIEAILREQPR